MTESAEQTPVGGTIREWCDENETTQADLAWVLGISQKHMSALVRGRATLTIPMAVKLEVATGISARMWMNLEFEYRIRKIREAEESAS
jgi:HTH-type transcriptional regulator/antitoxin HigA